MGVLPTVRGRWAPLLLTGGLLAACARPTPTEALPVPADHKVAFLVHGYISNADEFSEMARALTHGGEHGAPLHVHRFDFGTFSNVGSDHNLGAERLGLALGESVQAVQKTCPVCASWAEEPVDVTLVGRSFGGYVVREALLQDVEADWGPWRVDRVVTLASPLYGSTLTRYSTGFLSIIINGGIRTALMGFVQPERGGAFGRVIDAQIRAMRLGSPYQLDAHDRMAAWVRDDPPPWLVVPSLGAGDPVRKGDGVVRFSSANVAAVFPALHAQTLPVVVRHGNMFAGEPPSREARELDRALAAVRHFVDQGTLDGLDAVTPHHWTDDGLTPVDQGSASAQAVWLPSDQASDPDVFQRFDRLARADLGDVWLRFHLGYPGVDARPLTLARGLSPLQSDTEWSRLWLDLEVGDVDASGTSVVRVAPMARRHIFLPDVTPSGDWTVGVSLASSGPIPPERLRVQVNGGPVTVGNTVPVTPLQNSVVDVYIIAESTAAVPMVSAVRWRPATDR